MSLSSALCECIIEFDPFNPYEFNSCSNERCYSCIEKELKSLEKQILRDVKATKTDKYKVLDIVSHMQGAQKWKTIKQMQEMFVRNDLTKYDLVVNSTDQVLMLEAVPKQSLNSSQASLKRSEDKLHAIKKKYEERMKTMKQNEVLEGIVRDSKKIEPIIGRKLATKQQAGLQVPQKQPDQDFEYIEQEHKLMEEKIEQQYQIQRGKEKSQLEELKLKHEQLLREQKDQMYYLQEQQKQIEEQQKLFEEKTRKISEANPFLQQEEQQSEQEEERPPSLNKEPELSIEKQIEDNFLFKENSPQLIKHSPKMSPSNPLQQQYFPPGEEMDMDQLEEYMLQEALRQSEMGLTLEIENFDFEFFQEEKKEKELIDKLLDPYLNESDNNSENSTDSNDNNNQKQTKKNSSESVDQDQEPDITQELMEKNESIETGTLSSKKDQVQDVEIKNNNDKKEQMNLGQEKECQKKKLLSQMVQDISKTPSEGKLRIKFTDQNYASSIAKSLESMDFYGQKLLAKII